MWVKRSEDDLLPKWLAEHLEMNCPTCGAPKENYYNEEFRCTGTRCSNPKCPSMLAARAEYMFKLLKIKGIGYATCLSYFTGRTNVESHVECLRLLKDKPVVTVAEFLRMHCLGGIDSRWETICTKYGARTFDEFISMYPDDGEFAPLLAENYKLMKANEVYVTFKDAEKARHIDENTLFITIMITGGVNGFSSKEAFVNQLNTMMKGKIVIIHQQTKRQSGVDYLIREPGSNTRGKVEAAIRGGIPIVTSDEFIAILCKKLEALL